MTSGTRAARLADDQIKKVIEEVVHDSGLITDDRMARYMSDLQANLKSTLITEIEKATQPLVSQVASLERKLESYEARVVALDSKVDTLERKVESLERELKCCQVQKARMEIRCNSQATEIQTHSDTNSPLTFLTHIMLAIQIMVYCKQNKQNILTLFLLKGNEWQSNSVSTL